MPGFESADSTESPVTCKMTSAIVARFVPSITRLIKLLAGSAQTATDGYWRVPEQCPPGHYSPARMSQSKVKQKRLIPVRCAIVIFSSVAFWRGAEAVWNRK
jgi:hypothetical protein